MPGSKINKPCLIIKNNCEIKEFPINTANFLGKSIIFLVVDILEYLIIVLLGLAKNQII